MEEQLEKKRIITVHQQMSDTSILTAPKVRAAGVSGRGK